MPTLSSKNFKGNIDDEPLTERYKTVSGTFVYSQFQFERIIHFIKFGSQQNSKAYLRSITVESYVQVSIKATRPTHSICKASWNIGFARNIVTETVSQFYKLNGHTA